MSTLLEQAIVDAEALKEAAIKNAEATIIEKYSSEVKAAVESLIEQEGADLLGDLGELEEAATVLLGEAAKYAAVAMRRERCRAWCVGHGSPQV